MRRARMLAVLGVGLGLCLTPGPVAAATPQGAPASGFWGWAVVRDPTSSHVISNPRDRGSSSGGTVQVLRSGVGQYSVRFAGIDTDDGGNQGIALVTPLASTPRACSVNDWGSNGVRESVSVACFTRTEHPADTPFSLSFLAFRGMTGLAAYDWANDPNSASYIPDLNYQYNSTMAKSTIFKDGTGRWRVGFPSLGAVGGNVQVNAYGSSPEACRVVSFGTSAGDENVHVFCNDLPGGPTDTRYTVLWERGMGLKGHGVGAVAYLLADHPSSSSYVPAAATRFSSAGKAPRVFREGVGRYIAKLPGMPLGGGVQITAYGDHEKRCVASSIRRNHLPQKIGVRCFAVDGHPADSRFTLSYER